VLIRSRVDWQEAYLPHPYGPDKLGGVREGWPVSHHRPSFAFSFEASRDTASAPESHSPVSKRLRKVTVVDCAQADLLIDGRLPELETD